MRRVFKTRYFQRWARKVGLTDKALIVAINEMGQGLIDADLGGNVIKKRVALSGRGKSGGVRTLVVTNRGNHWFFVFGFAKTVRANITSKELEALQLLAQDLLQFTQTQLNQAVINGTLQEVEDDA